MSDPFVAEIRVFGFNFAPRGWAFCNGQLLPISQNTALFSLLGTTYGGNGTTNFGLPNFQSRVPMFYGQGPGLSLYSQGETGGSASVSLLLAEMAAHNHLFNVTSANGTQASAAGAQLARPFKGNLQSSNSAKLYSAAAPGQTMAATALSPTGGGQPHNNLMPYQTLNFCIALQGIFPPRS
jgi:microcystin-dependent protein